MTTNVDYDFATTVESDPLICCSKSPRYLLVGYDYVVENIVGLKLNQAES